MNQPLSTEQARIWYLVQKSQTLPPSVVDALVDMVADIDWLSTLTVRRRMARAAYENGGN